MAGRASRKCNSVGCANCLTLNRTEGREEKAGVRNRCLIFNRTDGNVGEVKYEEQKRISGEDALALWAGAGSRV